MVNYTIVMLVPAGSCKSVRRPAVDDDVFDAGPGLGVNAFDTGADMSYIVEYGSDNRNSHLSPNMSRVWEVRGHLVGFRRYFMKAVRSRLVSPAKE